MSNTQVVLMPMLMLVSTFITVSLIERNDDAFLKSLLFFMVLTVILIVTAEDNHEE